MEVKTVYIIKGNYMDVYKGVRDSFSYPGTDNSVMYECENDQWFITSSDKGVVEIEPDRAKQLLKL